MAEVKRTEERDVAAITLLDGTTIEAGPNQYFCKTQKCWELWQTIGAVERFVKRFKHRVVVWIHEK